MPRRAGCRRYASISTPTAVARPRSRTDPDRVGQSVYSRSDRECQEWRRRGLRPVLTISRSFVDPSSVFEWLVFERHDVRVYETRFPFGLGCLRMRWNTVGHARVLLKASMEPLLFPPAIYSFARIARSSNVAQWYGPNVRRRR